MSQKVSSAAVVIGALRVIRLNLILFISDETSSVFKRSQNFTNEPASTIKLSPERLLKKACRHVNMDDSGHQNWPEPKYYIEPGSRLMYCPLHGIKPDFWKYFFKLMRKERKGKTSQSAKDVTLYFSDKKVEDFDLILMSINPYLWLIHGYVDKLLLGMEICQPTSLQRFIDKLISGIKLRINQGLNYPPFLPWCRPCDVNVHSIIKYEHFAADVDKLLHSLGTSSSKMSSVGYDIEAAQQKEILDLTAASARRFKSRHCTNSSDFGLRLLEAYRLKGFVIPDLLKQYLSTLKSVNLPALETKVSQFIEEISVTSADDKMKLVHEIYSAVKPETKEYIQAIYKFEFEAFGYSSRP